MARIERPAWPGGAAVAVVVTVDHDAEHIWYRIDESVREREKTRSLGEYGPRRGVARVLDVLEAHGVRSTWFVPGAVALTHPASVEAVARRGHELGARGFELESFHGLGEREQAEALDRGADALERVAGVRPAGFRGYDDIDGVTLRLLLERGYRWTSLLRGDDRPSYLGGDGTAATALVDLPAPWELTDFPRFAFNYGPAYPSGQGRVSSYRRVLQDWIDEFEAYRAHGGLYLLTLDPQSIGKPGRIAILDRLLAHIRSQPGVWIATAGEVAEHWRATVPANDEGETESVRLRTLAERGPLG